MTYDKKSVGNVMMGSNPSCKTIGIGSIQIIMHDGIVRTLTNFRHAPKLNKNLICVGALDSKRWTDTNQRQMEVCCNARNQTRKFVHPSWVQCDRFCL